MLPRLTPILYLNARLNVLPKFMAAPILPASTIPNNNTYRTELHAYRTELHAYRIELHTYLTELQLF